VHKGKITGVDVQMPPDNAVVINCGGMLLLPGKALPPENDSKGWLHADCAVSSEQSWLRTPSSMHR
jgi:hypothetical protein